MKLVGVSVLALIIILGGYFLIFPAFNVIELEEESPLQVNDAMDNMDDLTKIKFVKMTKKMMNETVEIMEEMPQKMGIVAEGNFKPRAHEVEGKALLIESNGKKTLRFENFETINGPALYIYLAADLSDNDVVDLGLIKATKGNVNYEIPEGVDISRYKYVLVWCKPFRVLFSYAELK